MTSLLPRGLRQSVSSRLNLRQDQVLLTIGQAGLLAQRAARHTFVDLWDAELKVFSQWGEDGILNYMCDNLSLSKPRMLEIGVGDYRECNSRFLAASRSASVYAVDASPAPAATIAALDLAWRTTLCFEQIFVNPDNIRGIEERARAALGSIDVVSLDIDGNDYWVLDQMDLSCARIVVVEYNPVFGHERAVTVPRDDNFDRLGAHYSGLYWGASLAAQVQLLSARGFCFVGTNRAGNNAFFISNDELGRWSLPVPTTSDLCRYTDWRVNDLRDPEGQLIRMTPDERVALIGDLPLWDVVGEVNLKVKDATLPQAES